MSALPNPIPARLKQVNRAEVVDGNFVEFVQGHAGARWERPVPSDPVAPGSALDARGFLELFESQLISRHLDLMARVLRVKNKVFYTIGSSGHEGNAMVARLTRHTDPAFLHYRSGGFMAERFRKLPGMDPIMDSALSFAASKDDPASGGRHKVWGSKPLWVLPQTSTIGSHPPKALGAAIAIEQARRIGYELPIPGDSITICSFGDASANHSTAQGAFNAAQWTAYQGLPAPVLFVCEDNGIGISVKSPRGWIANAFANRPNLAYFFADGLNLAEGYAQVQAAVEHCRRTRQPTFLHLRTARLMGHAGTDFEDAACCPQPFVMTVQRLRIRPHGVASRLRIVATLAPNGLGDLNPLKEDVSLQLRSVGRPTLSCPQKLNGHWPPPIASGAQ